MFNEKRHFAKFLKQLKKFGGEFVICKKKILTLKNLQFVETQKCSTNSSLFFHFESTHHMSCNKPKN